MNKEIVLYSTGCPQCHVLETKLKAENIYPRIVTDTEVMISKGMTHAPMLEVEGTLLTFKQALEWINKRGENKIE